MGTLKPFSGDRAQVKQTCPCTGGCRTLQTGRDLLTGKAVIILPTSTTKNYRFTWVTFSSFTLHLGPVEDMIDGKSLLLLLVSWREFVFVLSLNIKRQVSRGLGTWCERLSLFNHAAIKQIRFQGQIPLLFEEISSNLWLQWQHLSQRLRELAKVISFCVSCYNASNG